MKQGKSRDGQRGGPAGGGVYSFASFLFILGCAIVLGRDRAVCDKASRKVARGHHRHRCGTRRIRADRAVRPLGEAAPEGRRRRTGPRESGTPRIRLCRRSDSGCRVDVDFNGGWSHAICPRTWARLPSDIHRTDRLSRFGVPRRTGVPRLPAAAPETVPYGLWTAQVFASPRSPLNTSSEARPGHWRCSDRASDRYSSGWPRLQRKDSRCRSVCMRRGTSGSGHWD